MTISLNSFEPIYNNMDLKLIDVLVDVEQNGVYLDSDELEESGKDNSSIGCMQ